MATYKMTLDFLGKDNVHFAHEYEVPEEIYKLIQNLKSGKKAGDKVFSVSSSDIGNFMKKGVDVCTPKLFRTAYGCKLLIDELQRLEKEEPLKKTDSIEKKVNQYNQACLAVTKKLNHQKDVSKNFDKQMDKLDESIHKAVENEKVIIEKAESQLKDLKKKISAAKKALEGEKLENTLQSYKEKKEKIESRVVKAQQRIENLQMKKTFKNETKTFSIGTARNAYSSPKIAYSWAKDHDVPINKIYSKSLTEKFEWAMNTPADYWKKFPNVK